MSGTRVIVQKQENDQLTSAKIELARDVTFDKVENETRNLDKHHNEAIKAMKVLDKNTNRNFTVLDDAHKINDLNKHANTLKNYLDKLETYRTTIGVHSAALDKYIDDLGASAGKILISHYTPLNTVAAQQPVMSGLNVDAVELVNVKTVLGRYEMVINDIVAKAKVHGVTDLISPPAPAANSNIRQSTDQNRHHHGLFAHKHRKHVEAEGVEHTHKDKHKRCTIM